MANNVIQLKNNENLVSFPSINLKRKRENIYIIGSRTNPKIPIIGNKLRAEGFHVFDDWFASGPETDSFWYKYESIRGKSYLDALNGKHAKHAFKFSFDNLNEADIAVLVLPCAKSEHLELGWALGQGKEGHILLDEKSGKWDLMYRFADGIWANIDELITALKKGNKNVQK